MKDYETIEEPILKEDEEYLSIQKIISRYNFVKDNQIADLESIRDYNNVFDYDNSNVEQELRNKHLELQELRRLRKEKGYGEFTR